MMEDLYEFGFSNVVVTSVFAVIACLVGLSSKRPHLTYQLWLLVLVKLVTPPIISIPFIEIPAMNVSGGASIAPENCEISEAVSGNDSLEEKKSTTWLEVIWPPGALIRISLLGSAIILLLSMYRARRFHSAMMSEIQPAPPEVEAMGRELAGVIGLKKLPKLSITSAKTEPMVWWMGGAVHVILPLVMLDSMKPKEWRWVLAHEMVHVKRRDYIVRWLECFAGAIWWWNPIMWWARQQLRVNEEICCDVEVLACLKSDSRSYAESILAVVEKLIPSTSRSLALASEITSGGKLENRIKMILNKSAIRKPSKGLQMVAVLGAMTILPLGFVYAEPDPSPLFSERLSSDPSSRETSEEELARELMESIKAGTLTEAQIAQRLRNYHTSMSKKRQQETAENYGRKFRHNSLSHKQKSCSACHSSPTATGAENLKNYHFKTVVPNE